MLWWLSKVVAAYMMIVALNKKGYNGFAISVPSLEEFLQIFTLAAPAFVAILSKVRVLLSRIIHSITSIDLWWFIVWNDADSFLCCACLLRYINGYKNSCCSSGLNVLVYFQKPCEKFILIESITTRWWYNCTAYALSGENLCLKQPSHLCPSWCMEPSKAQQR